MIFWQLYQDAAEESDKSGEGWRINTAAKRMFLYVAIGFLIVVFTQLGYAFFPWLKETLSKIERVGMTAMMTCLVLELLLTIVVWRQSRPRFLPKSPLAETDLLLIGKSSRTP